MNRVTIMFILACGALGACSYVNKFLGLENDHPVEQAVEEVIEENLGIELDLTPED